MSTRSSAKQWRRSTMRRLPVSVAEAEASVDRAREEVERIEERFNDDDNNE